MHTGDGEQAMRTLQEDLFGEGHLLRARLRGLLDETFGEAVPAPVATPWSPPADIWVTPEAVIVEVEVPGLGPDDVEAHVEGHVVTIAGLRSDGDAEDRYLQAERPRGRFTRSFALGQAPREVEARLDDGVLTLILRR